jgi:translation initiation factor 2B subunit (eIF-2B alpha/beta/delta family)
MVINYLRKKREFNRIAKDIKNVKIQGARSVAKEALKAYHLFPTKRAKKKLLSLRPTEPMLEKVLNLVDKKPYKEILRHFDQAQEKINKQVLKIIKNNDVIFTHCHSTNVIKALIYAKNKGKKFQVYNTETRPLFQGRKTAKELRKARIKTTMFVDAAIRVALTKKQKTKKVTRVFLGADALLKSGAINKVGSGMIAELAYNNKIPLYIIADSWKFTPKKIDIEQRSLNEVWDRAPKNIKIRNPAFEFISKRYIKAIVSELGTLNYRKFLKKVK